MAISPPSDILLDVASAADPASVRAATARLATLAADPAAQASGFNKALAAAKQNGMAGAVASTAALPGQMVSTMHAPATSAAARASGSPKHDTYQKFEAVLLTSFVEAMLPKDDDLYGDKQSASVYRSMLAEQFANQIAKAGGIGIAKAVEKAHPAQGAHAAASAISNQQAEAARFGAMASLQPSDALRGAAAPASVQPADTARPAGSPALAKDKSS